MTDHDRIAAKDILGLIASSALIGALLALFSSLQTFWRIIFSLGALFVGIRFFGKYDRLAMRVWLVVLSLVFFCVFTVILVMILYATGRITVAE